MNDKVAVVTGASSGIGMLTAVELAKAGFRVVATMRNPERRGQLDEAAAAAHVQDKIDVRQLDVTNFESIPGFFAALDRDYQRLDALVNNAGFSVVGFAEDVALDELRLQFETNFFGQVAVTQGALPVMRRQGSGHIVVVSSLGGLRAVPALSSYAASKFAMEGWSEALRLECVGLGIMVVLIEPGAFDTGVWRNVRLAKKVQDGTAINRERGKAMRARAKNVHKGDPAEVAKTILRAIENPHPPLRYLVGRDAHEIMRRKRLLPWNWYEKWLRRTKLHI
jgi:NAD(P)-dependent dehydrogenase (short-subunit alcohol dehydrogenase family)